MITHEEIRRQVEEKDVRYLRLIFTDILGTIKNVEVPITQLDKVLANKMMFDGSSIEGFVRIEESDMYLSRPFNLGSIPMEQQTRYNRTFNL